MVARVDVSMARLIKRYGNRKMYDTKASRYVTLDGVTELIRSGEDLKIIDNESGDDLTAVTFAQIIYEEEKRKSGLLEVPALRWIIQQGGATLHEILSRVDQGREAIENVREMAEERVRNLMQRGEHRHNENETKHTDARDHGQPEKGASPQGLRVLSDLLEGPQKQLEQLQHRIDSQVRASIERLTQHPTLRKELQRIEDNIKGLERQLSRLRGQPEKPAKKTGKRKKR
jgi:polyhydroxyalkanoate synthesis repressor PhaR